MFNPHELPDRSNRVVHDCRTDYFQIECESVSGRLRFSVFCLVNGVRSHTYFLNEFLTFLLTLYAFWALVYKEHPNSTHTTVVTTADTTVAISLFVKACLFFLFFFCLKDSKKYITFIHNTKQKKKRVCF